MNGAKDSAKDRENDSAADRVADRVANCLRLDSRANDEVLD